MIDAKSQIIKEYSIRSFYNFFKLFWGEVESAEYVDNYHIKLICDALQERFRIWEENTSGNWVDREFYDLLINLPPGSSKSLIVSVYFPVWI